MDVDDTYADGVVKMSVEQKPSIAPYVIGVIAAVATIGAVGLIKKREGE